MRATQLFDDNGLRTYLLVMYEGDEAFSEITEFAKANDVDAATLTANRRCMPISCSGGATTPPSPGT
jgi:predicted DNA-binding protein with PD1-like motif